MYESYIGINGVSAGPIRLGATGVFLSNSIVKIGEANKNILKITNDYTEHDLAYIQAATPGANDGNNLVATVGFVKAYGAGGGGEGGDALVDLQATVDSHTTMIAKQDEVIKNLIALNGEQDKLIDANGKAITTLQTDIKNNTARINNIFSSGAIFYAYDSLEVIE